jgi:hypothetical protein
MTAPWVISILAAIWFAQLGRRADGRWMRGAVGGALFALTASTIVLGLCDSAMIPISHETKVSYHFKSLVLAILPILLVGGSVTFMLSKGNLPSEKTGRV